MIGEGLRAKVCNYNHVWGWRELNVAGYSKACWGSSGIGLKFLDWKQYLFYGTRCIATDIFFANFKVIFQILNWFSVSDCI